VFRIALRVNGGQRQCGGVSCQSEIFYLSGYHNFALHSTSPGTRWVMGRLNMGHTTFFRIAITWSSKTAEARAMDPVLHISVDESYVAIGTNNSAQSNSVSATQFGVVRRCFPAASNSSPGIHPASPGSHAAFDPSAKPNLAITASPVKSMSGLYSSLGW